MSPPLHLHSCTLHPGDCTSVSFFLFKSFFCRRNFFCSWEWRSRPTVFQIFLIYIKLTTLTTFLSKLVQFICYHSLITNNKAMPKENSEFVTLAILKEMLAAQERAYKITTQLLVDDMRSEIRSLRSEVDELKESVKFTSAKYEELEGKSQKVQL